MGIDYVYISKGKDPKFYTDLLKVMVEFHEFVRVSFKDYECANTTIRMLCHYYLPPCGNSTHYEPPISVCPVACEALKEKCTIFFNAFQRKLMVNTSDRLDCFKSVIDPLPHICSNLDIGESVTTVVDCVCYSNSMHCHSAASKD